MSGVLYMEALNSDRELVVREISPRPTEHAGSGADPVRWGTETVQTSLGARRVGHLITSSRPYSERRYHRKSRCGDTAPAGSQPPRSATLEVRCAVGWRRWR